MKVAKLKIILLIILVASFLFYPSKTFALDIIGPSQTGEYNSYDYVIDAYDVDIVVKENNTLDITENIVAYFNVPKHGIFRTIPLKETVTRLDGTTTTSKSKVSKVKVDNNFSTSKENGYYKIKIGSASTTLTGSQSYQIKYSYKIGRDHVKDFDELYYNIIGSEWDTVIGNVTFKITMPKDFDASKLGFSKGEYGSIGNDGIEYTVDGNVITGSYYNVLKTHEALTVRLELEEGYFVIPEFPKIIQYMVFIVPLVSVIISYILWKKYGKDDEVIETVEFYPPEGFNSLEVGFLYKGKADNQDVTSLLVYLANKGYIKITETEEKNLFSKSKGFKITKLKDYDGNNQNERLFLEGLFSRATKISIPLIKKDLTIEEKKQEELEEVTASDLQNHFYITMNKILGNANSSKNKHKIFEKATTGKSIKVILLILLSLFTIIAIPTLEYGDSETLLIAIFFTAFYVPFYAVGFIKSMPIVFRVFWLGFTIFHSSIMLGAFFVAESIFENPLYIYGLIFGIICIIGMFICFKEMPKRTPYGNEVLGKIRGFKSFLETAEKARLEAMVMDNPTYFYDILPYTYVLGVSDKWIKKFESIAMQEPDWYDGRSTFNVNTFGSFMNSTMASAKSAMVSSPSSSSSSGGHSSGGGFSGGGHGGGGGGSW